MQSQNDWVHRTFSSADTTRIWDTVVAQEKPMQLRKIPYARVGHNLENALRIQSRFVCEITGKPPCMREIFYCLFNFHFIHELFSLYSQSDSTGE